ncbi:hypothetical protein [Bdellovibrio bacteriovorus]|uniref:hypothetical protein n=1 Tax=Bdellovibrio bacteriovorus TaxID=959 RepID=UPI003AA881AD
MLRVGRFRHRLLEDDFLEKQSPLAHKCLQVFMRLWHSKSLSDAEIAAIYILIFSFLRRPKDFLGGPHNQILASLPAKSRMSCQDFYELLQKELPEDLRQAKSLTRFQRPDDLLSFFCAHSWRSIPLSVAQSLMAWENGLYPLRLLSNVPTPEEVLSMQTQGQRCVSMLQDLKEMQEFVEEGRDVLGFIVHDLIHADHFFADPVKARAQIEFSRRLMVVFGFHDIQVMLQSDPVFKKEFEYLMSDMNSFPLHLLKTFKAVLLGYFKRREGLAMTEALPEATEAEFQRLFESSLKVWELPEEAHRAAQRLNTPLFQGLDDSLLLHSALLQYQ